jgi:chromate reductase
MNILLFSGSLRKDSFNRKLVAIANGLLSEKPGIQSEVVDIKVLNIPVYDGDVETAGIPDGVKRLADMISKSNALIISSPEYNGSIAGSFKNTIDWISRVRPMPLDKKSVLMMGASQGAFGAISGAQASCAVFDRLNAYQYPQFFTLPKAQDAFNESGELKDESSKKRLSELMNGYLQFAEKLTKSV